MLNLNDYSTFHNNDNKENFPNLFIIKSRYLRKKRISLKNFLNEKDQNTKKRFENKVNINFNNENLNLINYKSLNNQNPSKKQISDFFPKKFNKIFSNHLKQNKYNLDKIYFEDDVNKKIINFHLFTDNIIYDSNPFNEKLIQMNRDDDVLSDEELIKNSKLFLYKEMNYAIKIYEDKKLKNNNKFQK